VTRLLESHEPAPVTVERESSASPFFLICDHASNRIPECLGSLGLGAEDLNRHIAWDIGAAGVAGHLSQQLDATLVMQNYSRLVIDCNRPPESAELIPALSEATGIPGNRELANAERAARRMEIFTPYHERIAALLDARQASNQPTLLISVHSFTPVYLGESRPQHVGVLYDRDRRVAEILLQGLRADTALSVGDNEPYKLDGKDYGIPIHAEDRGLPYALFEIRQDLIETIPEQKTWATRLAGLLEGAAECLLE
jgi:predicted N-formylglutamate amidohydrolase